MQDVQKARIEGLWLGRWESDTTGHRGSLRCRLVHLAGRHFRAEFRARYWIIFPFGRDIRITFRPEGEIFRCTGTEDLGKWGGGNYQYSGTLSDRIFEAIFASQKYRGNFRLERGPER